jgi:hypothetical protein
MTLASQVASVLVASALAFSAIAEETPRHEQQLMRFMSYGEGFAHALAGSSTRQTSKKHPNIHLSGQFNKVVTEHLFDVEISWLYPPPHHKFRMLLSLSVSKGTAHLPELKIGQSTEADIRSAFGTPVNTTANRLTYHAPTDAGSDVLVFHLRNGKLSRVYWKWYID